MVHKDHYYKCPDCKTEIRVHIPYSPDYADCRDCSTMMEETDNE